MRGVEEVERDETGGTRRGETRRGETRRGETGRYRTGRDEIKRQDALLWLVVEEWFIELHELERQR